MAIRFQLLAWAGASAAALVLLAPAPAGDAASAVSTSIAVDGRFEDWRAVARAGEAEGLPEIRIASDSQGLFFYLDLGREANLDRLPGALRIAVDADADPETGQRRLGLDGADWVVEIPPASGLGAGIRPVPSDAARGPAVLSPGDRSLLLAPTFASQRYELRFARAASGSDPILRIAGPQVRIVVALADKVDLETALASSGVIEHEMVPYERHPPSDSTPNPFAHPAGSDFRVVSWNVYKLRLRERPDAFLRVLQALDPDLLLLSEVSTEASEDELDEWLERLVGRREWAFALGASGGTQRNLIACRRGVHVAYSFLRLPYPDPDRSRVLEGVRERGSRERLQTLFEGGVSAVGARATVAGHRLLTIAADLTCCGRAGGREDQIRRLEAEAIGRAARLALGQRRHRGVIIAGDFNLVATRAPLDHMRRGLDPGGGDLTVADPLHLDGSANYTWAQPGSAFPPGRLDFLLYSKSSLELLDSFVLDARELPSRVLERHRVRADDTDPDVSSDHLPIVADFAWRKD